MKTISLWQPWASLIAIGAKRFETRGRPTNVRGRIAIHAAKKWLPDFVGPRATDARFTAPLYRAGIRDVPLGAIVATADLVACVEIDAEPAEIDLVTPSGRLVETIVIPPAEPERSFGDYTPGRFAWVLRDVVRLARPVQMNGHQGWFDVPDNVIAAAGRV